MINKICTWRRSAEENEDKGDAGGDSCMAWTLREYCDTNCHGCTSIHWKATSSQMVRLMKDSRNPTMLHLQLKGVQTDYVCACVWCITIYMVESVSECIGPNTHNRLKLILCDVCRANFYTRNTNCITKSKPLKLLIACLQYTCFFKKLIKLKKCLNIPGMLMVLVHVQS